MNIIGFEGARPEGMQMTWGSAAIQVDNRVYNSLRTNTWIDMDEVPRPSISLFLEPVPCPALEPLWVVAMTRDSFAERIGTKMQASEGLYMPLHVSIRSLTGHLPPIVKSTVLFLTPDQFKVWAEVTVKEIVGQATNMREVNIAMCLEPRSAHVHAKRWHLSDRKEHVKSTAKVLLSPEDFEIYVDLTQKSEQ